MDIEHYDNTNGSLYKFAEDHNLNSYEFDIIKRTVRCRKKGNFKEDLEKTKYLIDLYIQEQETNSVINNSLYDVPLRDTNTYLEKGEKKKKKKPSPPDSPSIRTVRGPR